MPQSPASDLEEHDARVPPAAPSTPPLDTEAHALMRRVAIGDPIAFETLYQHYTPRLMRYLQPRLGERQLAEEVCQDIWLVVWNQCDRFHSLSPLSTWLFGIAQRLMWKAHARRVNWTDKATLMTEPESEEESPEASLCRQSHQHRVAQAIAALPPTLRQTITLRYDRDYTYREIAAHMGCAEATVKDRLRQARRRLAATLRQQERCDAMELLPIYDTMCL